MPSSQGFVSAYVNKVLEGQPSHDALVNLQKMIKERYETLASTTALETAVATYEGSAKDEAAKDALRTAAGVLRAKITYEPFPPEEKSPNDIATGTPPVRINTIALNWPAEYRCLALLYSLKRNPKVFALKTDADKKSPVEVDFEAPSDVFYQRSAMSYTPYEMVMNEQTDPELVVDETFDVESVAKRLFQSIFVESDFPGATLKDLVNDIATTSLYKLLDGLSLDVAATGAQNDKIKVMRAKCIKAFTIIPGASKPFRFYTFCETVSKLMQEHRLSYIAAKQQDLCAPQQVLLFSLHSRSSANMEMRARQFPHVFERLFHKQFQVKRADCEIVESVQQRDQKGESDGYMCRITVQSRSETGDASILARDVRAFRTYMSREEKPIRDSGYTITNSEITPRSDEVVAVFKGVAQIVRDDSTMHLINAICVEKSYTKPEFAAITGFSPLGGEAHETVERIRAAEAFLRNIKAERQRVRNEWEDGRIDTKEFERQIKAIRTRTDRAEQELIRLQSAVKTHVEETSNVIVAPSDKSYETALLLKKQQDKQIKIAAKKAPVMRAARASEY